MEYQYIKNKNFKSFNEVTDKEDLQTVADNIMKLSDGNVRGDIIINCLNFIRNEKGDSGVDMVGQKMKNLGYPFDFNQVNKTGLYLESYKVLIIILYKELFNATDEDIFNMGRFCAKKTIFLKALVRYFISAKTLVKKSPGYWSKVVDFGELEIIDLNEKEKHLIFRIYNYIRSTIVCTYHAGYFIETLSYVVKANKISIEETACNHSGDNFHEFIIRWV